MKHLVNNVQTLLNFNGASYCIFFTITLCINKYILSSFMFNFPTVLQGWQTASTTLIIFLLKTTDKEKYKESVHAPGFTIFVPHLVFHVLQLVTGSKALSLLPISVFLCGINSSDALINLILKSNNILRNLIGALVILSSGVAVLWKYYEQSDIDEDSGDDDDDDVDPNDVYGVTSIINLTDKQHYECVDQLRNLLREMCAEHGTDQSNAYVRAMLSDTNTVGLLINERFINFPAQIAVPLLESLVKEIERAKEKKLNYNFSYIIIICKLYKEDATEKKKKKKGKKKNAEPEIIWTNPEEELFDQEADCRFEFSVRNESDSALSGEWMEDDRVLKPYRRVLILSADKLQPIIDKIKDFVSPAK